MKQRLMIVGAFPPPGREVYGGMVTACRGLLNSSLPRRVELVLLDSTQKTNPPPGILTRLVLSVIRFVRYIVLYERTRPHGVLLFTAVGMSVLEKGAMAWYAKIRHGNAMLFPRGGALIHDFRERRSARALVRFAVSGSTRVLCQGRAWHDFAVQELGLEPREAPIVRSWTASDDLLAVGRQRGESAGLPIRLLFVGWLDYEKGTAELLRACGKLRDTGPFELTFVGEGNASADLRALAGHLGIADRVRFAGWRRGEELKKAYEEADIFVLPSWAEGLPNAMIEAMAAGLAIVVTPVGIIPEVIEDSRTGLIVPVKDHEALAAALERLMRDPGFRARLGSAAHHVAATRFSVEKAADRLVAVMDSLSDRRETIVTKLHAGNSERSGCPLADKPSE